MNYYELLGISPTATAEEIRQAYIKSSKSYHPDVNNAPNANFIFRQVKEAYEVLSNPTKRTGYDLMMGYKTTVEKTSVTPSKAVYQKNTVRTSPTKSTFIDKLMPILIAIFLIILLLSFENSM